MNYFIDICKYHGETNFTRTRGDKHKRCVRCRSESVQRRRDKVKVLSVQYLGGKCCKCGYNKCIKALEFHHLNPTQKEFALSKQGHTRSWEKIKIELDKCVLLCANCHRELHANDSRT